MREIRDDAGVDWLVYEVQRREALTTSGPDLPEPLRNGWLCFESGSEKRRLTPTPAGWESLPAGELARLLGAAAVVKRPAQKTT
jgi:hypothetical protein